MNIVSNHFSFQVYSDMESKKPGIFERLEKNVHDHIEDIERLQRRIKEDDIQSKEIHTTSEHNVRIVGLNKASSSSSSIFDRLGGKDDEKRVKSILKSSPSSKKVSITEFVIRIH